MLVAEQPSVQPMTVRPYPSSVPPGVKNVFVWYLVDWDSST